jgi:zinc and cadmium transporter
MAGSVFGTVMAANTLACAVTTGGVYTSRRCEQWGSDHVAYFVSLCAGVLISVSFIHIIPKSFTMSGAAPSFLPVGFLELYLVNRFLNTYVCHEHQHTNKKINATHSFHCFVVLVAAIIVVSKA